MCPFTTCLMQDTASRTPLPPAGQAGWLAPLRFLPPSHYPERLLGANDGEAAPSPLRNAPFTPGTNPRGPCRGWASPVLNSARAWPGGFSPHHTPLRSPSVSATRLPFCGPFDNRFSGMTEEIAKRFPNRFGSATQAAGRVLAPCGR